MEAVNVLGGPTAGQLLGSGIPGTPYLRTDMVPQSATSTATLTVDQIRGGVLVANPSTTAAVYTLPTAAEIDASLSNAQSGVHSFTLNIVNKGTSSGTVTLALGTGLTDGGNALVAVAITSSAQFLFRKTATGAWTVYKIA